MTTKITEQNISNIRNAGVQWQSPKTANFDAVAGEGYFVNTSGGAFTMTMPASPVIGDTISVSVITAGNNLTIDRNGNNIDGSASNTTLGTDGDAKTFVYVNASEGFKTLTSTVADTYVSATGGTESTSGNYKIHVYNSSSNFVVSSVSNNAENNEVSYLVVGGGAGGGVGCSGGGGGAGGYREGKSSVDCYSGSPTAATSGITVSAATYPITVGGGGSGISPYSSPSHPAPSSGTAGSDSTFSTITSAGGGKGGGQPAPSGSSENDGSGNSRGGIVTTNPTKTLQVEGDISASGEYFGKIKDIKNSSFYHNNSSNRVWIPLAGTLSETTSTYGQPYTTILAPYGGRLVKVLLYNQVTDPGLTTVTLHTGSFNSTLLLNDKSQGIQSITVDMVDDTTTLFKFSSSIALFDAGDRLGITVDRTSTNSNYFIATSVWEYDTSNEGNF